MQPPVRSVAHGLLRSYLQAHLHVHARSELTVADPNYINSAIASQMFEMKMEAILDRSECAAAPHRASSHARS